MENKNNIQEAGSKVAKSVRSREQKKKFREQDAEEYTNPPLTYTVLL